MSLTGAPSGRVRLPIVVTVTELQQDEVAYVDRCLPLNRLDQQRAAGSTYLVFVVPERRRGGIAAQLTDAAEQEARVRGWDTISLSVSQHGNIAARKLYAKLGYADAGIDPVRVSGTIMLRGRPFEVDDTLVYLVKSL
jgi:GNAT superfamily N-acetyltransferase